MWQRPPLLRLTRLIIYLEVRAAQISWMNTRADSCQSPKSNTINNYRGARRGELMRRTDKRDGKEKTETTRRSMLTRLEGDRARGGCAEDSPISGCHRMAKRQKYGGGTIREEVAETQGSAQNNDDCISRCDGSQVPSGDALPEIFFLFVSSKINWINTYSSSSSTTASSLSAGEAGETTRPFSFRGSGGRADALFLRRRRRQKPQHIRRAAWAD